MLIVLSILIFSSTGFSQNKNGIIDLTKADFTKINSISGNWEFYWSELLTPQEIENKNSTPNYIKVNGVWNGYNYHGKILGGNGYATFRVKILVPKAGHYSLKFNQILSAYKVWINGEVKMSVGKVGKNKESTIAVVNNNELIFKTTTDTIELVMQVCNYHHRVGGIQEEIKFGTPNVVQAKTNYNLLITFFIIGAELIFALYFLFSFFFRQKDFSFIFFSIAILLTIAFELVNNEMVLLRFFDQIDLELQKKIDFFSNYSRLSFFILFLWYSFKEYKLYNKLTFIFIFLISAALSILVLSTSCSVYSYTIMVFIVLGTSSFIYFLIATGIGVLKKVPFIIYSFLGLLALNIAGINDSLYTMNIINTTYLLNVGLLLFFIGNSITLSLKFSKSEESAKILAQKFYKYEYLLTEFLTVYSFDLERILKILDNFVKSDYLELIINDRVFICECKKSFDNSIICGKQEKNYKSQIDFEKNDKNFNKNTIDILEMLVPQISTFIDNYKFYVNLESLNKNLETIIEARTQLAFEQKLELEVKGAELSEKIVELKEASNIVEDLNTELNQQKEKLAIKNNQLGIYKKQILLQKKVLEDKEAYIKESINYAKKIQKVFFSSTMAFPFKEYLFYTSPKEIISGDFVSALNKKDFFIIAVVDTTGTNVSASFLTVLLHTLLEDIILENPDYITDTQKIIEKLRYHYLGSLDISDENRFIKDSFNISLCSINKKNGETFISSVGQPVIIFKGEEQIIIDGDNFTIGGHHSNFEKELSIRKINLNAGDSIFLFTDGYYNQISQTSKKKMGLQHFSKYLKEISNFQPTEQKEFLDKKFHEWKGNIKRVDDYTIVSFKYFPTEK